MNFNAEAMTDSYKIGMSMLHELSIFGKLVEIVNSYSNFTPRKNAYMTFCDQSDGHIVVYGTRDTYQEIVRMWDETFFKVDRDKVMKRLKRRTMNHFGSVTEHKKFLTDMRYLHALGYLPLEVRAIDEGTKYPLGLPMFTVEATEDGYGWLVNFTETLSSGLIWPMTNTATKVEQFYLQSKYYGELSAPQEVVDQWLPICVHEFGMRGYRGPQDQVRTSSAHSLFFLGSDTISVIDFFEENYDANSDVDPIAVSVRASEHADISRMLSLFRKLAQDAIDNNEITHKCVAELSTAEEQAAFKISTLKEGECVKGYRGSYFENIDEEPSEVFPINVNPRDVLDNTEFYVLKYFVDNSTGIMSYVSDTENYYRLLNVYAKSLRGAIEAREAREDGQPPIFVFRPDSSRRTPLTVICGYQIIDDTEVVQTYIKHPSLLDEDECAVIDGKYYLNEKGYLIEITKEEAEGSLISLWNTFGGTEVETNAGLMKLINPAVGLIYGEAISQQHQKEIYERMIEMGFSAVNILMGKGSYASLEGSTRDLFSMSYKQTFSEAKIGGMKIVDVSGDRHIHRDMIHDNVCFYDGEQVPVLSSGELSPYFIMDPGSDPIFDEEGYLDNGDVITIPVEQARGKCVNLAQQKTPMGDQSKTSAKGMLCVDYVDTHFHGAGQPTFILEQEVTRERQQEGKLTLLMRNGEFFKKQSLNDIKATYAAKTYYYD